MSVSLIDRFWEPVLTPDVARRIIELQPDPEFVSHVRELAVKSNAGTLSESERQEYEQFVSENDLFAILQAKARKVLRRQAE